MKTKLFLFVIGIAIVLSSCSTKENKDEINKPHSLIMGDPMSCGIDNTLIFPVGSNYSPEIIENSDSESPLSSVKLSFSANDKNFYDRFAKEEFVNNNENKFDITNILFYNLKNGQSFPLLKDSLHILSFALHKELEKPMIFYRIVKKDNNNDSKFNSEDAVILYVSDLNGKELKQVTPDNEKFVDYFLYAENQTILFKTIIDSNKDKKFTNIDETNFREIKIMNPEMGREIFSKSAKDSLRIN